jgi:hypothetical protein
MTHRKPGFLVNRPDSDCVLLFAVPATPEVTAIALSRLSISHFVDGDTATLHTAWIVSPTLHLEEFDSRKFVCASGWNPFDNAGLREVVAFLFHE